MMSIREFRIKNYELRILKKTDVEEFKYLFRNLRINYEYKFLILNQIGEKIWTDS